MPKILLEIPARVAPERIGFVKFILEGYDDLAILSTADKDCGNIILRCHPDRHDELIAIMAALGVGFGEGVIA